MKYYNLLLISILGCSAINAQQLEWAKSFGGSEYEEGYGIVVDQNGNVFTTGYFYDYVDFDPDTTTYELTTVNGNYNTFINKLDSEGNFLGVISFEGGDNEPSDIILDTDDNLYITGYFYDTVDFNPGSGINKMGVASSGAYIVKLDVDGNFLWCKMFDSSYGVALALTSEGSIIISGTYTNTVDFDPGVGVFELTAVGSKDIFVAKLDSLGNFIWARSIGGTSYEESMGVAVNASNDVYLTGYFYTTVDFDPSAGIYELTSNGLADAFLVKLNEDGYLIWAESLGGVGNDQIRDIGIDSNEDVYLCGNFSNTLVLDQGSSLTTLNSNGYTDAIIVKCNATGDFIWAKSIGGTDYDDAYSIDIDPLDNVIVSGSFVGNIDMNPGINEEEVTSNGSDDVFLIALNSLGVFQWGASFGGIWSDVSYALTTDAEGNIYTTGYFESPSANFNFDPFISELINSGEIDVFVQKISPDYHLGTDLDLTVDFNLYPNPAEDHVILNLNQFNEEVKITIFNALGELVHFQEVYSGIITITTDFPAGVYLVGVEGEKAKLQKKLIVR
ncbi:MAG: SBBP repeat-containing protein [Flavobacteriales bacterium]|nr:SBBP repeat-containing protein [Flavobacteriales bacterium]